ncbi:mechanosensitive ion channel family protein [Microbacterium sp. ASV49]|uniref:Mechanosensitive ion channel family protein n=1 Tax=Microbacterium candidum TaxID=3041922 RepID=A0ABT7MTE1_9MICO|nr:mechanosensitive ion channel family protein [Microbacterium sp. ASV49]MDL9977719.1 mechanosensitive ion channel family protein [Microbacterium sp. ASV49]
MSATPNPEVTAVTSVLNSINWWQLAAAVSTVILGWILGVIARRAVLAILARASGISPGAAELIARIVKYTIVLFAVGLALVFLGANVQPLLAITLIIVVVVVLMLRGVADNFAAGVLLQSRHAVKPGDRLEVDGPTGSLVGTVKEVNARSVILVTLDGRTAHIPSTVLTTGVLVNHSTHGARRSSVDVRVERRGAGVQDIVDMLEAAMDLEGVHEHPKAEAVVTSITPVRVAAELRFWHHPARRVKMTAAVVRSASDALEAAGHKATVTSGDQFGPIIPADPV